MLIQANKMLIQANIESQSSPSENIRLRERSFGNWAFVIAISVRRCFVAYVRWYIIKNENTWKTFCS